MSSEDEVGGIDVAAAIAAYDRANPRDELDLQVEMIRSGLQTQFWAWLERVLRTGIEQDVLMLSDPSCKEDVNFLRGKIHARNQFLRLPTQLVEAYDDEQEYDGEANPQLSQKDNPTVRRGSPTPEGDD